MNRMWRARSLADLIADQLAGIDGWIASQAHERSLVDLDGTREARVEGNWRLEALDWERSAVHARLLLDDVDWLGTSAPRAVVVHRHAWVRDEIAAKLGREGIVVVECLEDGADAVAAVVLHQPEVLVLGDLLPRVPAAELTRRCADLAPMTAVVVVGQRTPAAEVVLQALGSLAA